MAPAAPRTLPRCRFWSRLCLGSDRARTVAGGGSSYPGRTICRGYYIAAGFKTAWIAGFRMCKKIEKLISTVPSDWTWGTVFLDKEIHDESQLPVKRHKLSEREIHTWDGETDFTFGGAQLSCPCCHGSRAQRYGCAGGSESVSRNYEC